MGGTMKLAHFIIILCLFVFLLVCKEKMDVELEKSNPLEGTTWELTSGKWVREDTTFIFPNSPYEKRIIIFGKTHYNIVSQDTSLDLSFFASAKYTIDGDNLIPTFKMFSYYETIGNSFTPNPPKFQIKDNQLIVKAADYQLGGNYWKELYEVHKRID